MSAEIGKYFGIIPASIEGMSSDSLTFDDVKAKIYLIRGRKVLLDSDLADLYEVETKNLNKAVQRNIGRFPQDFMFQLSWEEYRNLKFQTGASSLQGADIIDEYEKRRQHGGRRKLPFVFTQEGVAMLSGVLHSDRAIQVNITIMRTFVKLRALMTDHQEFAQKLATLEQKYDRQFKVIFDAIRELMSGHRVPHKRIIGLGNQDG